MLLDDVSWVNIELCKEWRFEDEAQMVFAKDDLVVYCYMFQKNLNKK